MEDTLNQYLAEIGFKSLKEYRSSKMWNIIQQHVLDRDAGQCRAKRCNDRAVAVVPMAYSVPILLGKSPHCLISVCDYCFDQIVLSEDLVSRPIAEQLSITVIKITGTEITKGVSSPYLGKWFKNQYSANIRFGQQLKTALKDADCYV